MVNTDNKVPPTSAAQFDGLAPLYLVVHFPPHDTRLDRVAFGRHAGSRALRAWVERVQPVELYCGHIHECAGKSDTLGATRWQTALRVVLPTAGPGIFSAIMIGMVLAVRSIFRIRLEEAMK